MKPLKDFAQDQKNSVIIAAHRGSSGTAPENTLAALREAIDAGASMIEIDVQFSADNYAMLLHDPTLDRTTNAQGSVRGKRLQELQELDAGSWFSERFRGERIPLLAEALDLLKGKVYINIEIKEPHEDEDYNARVERIAAIIAERGLAAYSLFSSFHHATLAAFKERHPEFHTAAINIPGDTRLPSEILAAIGCDAFVCDLDELNAERLADIHRHGIYTGVYTVNTREQLVRALNCKINAVVTNFPRLIADEMKLLARLP